MNRTTMRLSCALGIMAGLYLGQPASAAEFRLMTGPQGGVWVPLGGALKAMWEGALPGATVHAVPGAGIANVRGVDEGKALGKVLITIDESAMARIA